jgi:hypothetical protein
MNDAPTAELCMTSALDICASLKGLAVVSVAAAAVAMHSSGNT